MIRSLYCWWFWIMRNPNCSILFMHIYLLRRWHLSLALESICAPLNNVKYFIPLVLTSLTFIALFHLCAIEIATWWNARRINIFRLIGISFYVHTLQVDLKDGHVSLENYIIWKDARLAFIVFAYNAYVNAK